MLFTAQLIVFGLAVWVGLYLLANDMGAGRQWLAAVAVFDLACAVAVTMLWTDAAGLRWATGLVVASASVWTGAVIALMATPTAAPRWSRIWQYGLLPSAIFLAAAPIIAPQVGTLQEGVWPWIVLAIVVAPLLLASLVVMNGQAPPPGRSVRRLLALATSFYLLGLCALLFVQNELLGRWFVAAVTFDLSLLGLIAIAIHAHRQGERVFADFMRSFDGALLAAFLFGTPVLVTMHWATAPSAAMKALLLVVLFLAIAGQTLNDLIQALLDRVAFRRIVGLPQERQTLRATAASLPRRDDEDLLALADDEFVRVTRRALSNLGNLPKLAASPLTRLPAVDARLAAQRLDDNTLTRAAELKRLLQDGIDALKPLDAAEGHGAGEHGFNASEAWRFYNALYYPYVVGIKPYRRQPATFDLAPDAQAALDWLRTDVPERTLYNWQNAAAELVAQHLREA